jgi:ribonuclease HI
MLGIGTAQAALAYGADDIDGTVRHELIYHDAGAETPEILSVEQIRRLDPGSRPRTGRAGYALPPRRTRRAEYGGRWRFVLQTPEGKTLLDAEDEEEGDSRERLELLAIVRGLEALDQPSQVTLVTQSQAISRGVREGLAQWRENDYQWERFGSLTPIKNRDLWQRVDQALSIHQVQCRLTSGGGQR